MPICGKASWVAALGATETLFVGDSDIDYWQTSPQFVDSENIGFGGYTCEDVVGEIDAYQATFGTPATVVLVCGENDLAYGSSVAATFNFFKEIVAKANAAGGTVIHFGTKPEPDTRSLHDEYEAYDAKIRDLVSMSTRPLRLSGTLTPCTPTTTSTSRTTEATLTGTARPR